MSNKQIWHALIVGNETISVKGAKERLGFVDVIPSPGGQKKTNFSAALLHALSPEALKTAMGFQLEPVFMSAPDASFENRRQYLASLTLGKMNMATFDQVNQIGPVLIDPFHYDLDTPLSSRPVEGVAAVTLTGADATLFYQWVSSHWRTEFEKNLQSLSRHADHGDLLTTWLPLVTFREDLCCRGIPRADAATQGLLDRLRQMTREWRAAGVDEVYISGCDLRDSDKEGGQ